MDRELRSLLPHVTGSKLDGFLMAFKKSGILICCPWILTVIKWLHEVYRKNTLKTELKIWRAMEVGKFCDPNHSDLQDLILWCDGSGRLVMWSFGTTDAQCIVPQELGSKNSDGWEVGKLRPNGSSSSIFFMAAQVEIKSEQALFKGFWWRWLSKALVWSSHNCQQEGQNLNPLATW